MEKNTKYSLQRTQTSYITGYILSIVLTLIAYIVVVNHIFESGIVFVIILFLAFVQLVVQMFFFLHLGQEEKSESGTGENIASGPRWNLLVFLSTLGIVLIIVIASIWIMSNLNYNMTPQQIEQYVQGQDGF